VRDFQHFNNTRKVMQSSTPFRIHDEGLKNIKSTMGKHATTHKKSVNFAPGNGPSTAIKMSSLDQHLDRLNPKTPTTKQKSTRKALGSLSAAQVNVQNRDMMTPGTGLGAARKIGFQVHIDDNDNNNDTTQKKANFKTPGKLGERTPGLKNSSSNVHSIKKSEKKKPISTSSFICSQGVTHEEDPYDTVMRQASNITVNITHSCGNTNIVDENAPSAAADVDDTIWAFQGDEEDGNGDALACKALALEDPDAYGLGDNTFVFDEEI